MLGDLPWPYSTITPTSSGAVRGRPRSGALYRYLVLPGNESVLLREALERRPWWEPASSSTAQQGPNQQQHPQHQQHQQRASDNTSNWNLWAGLNGQRFTQWDVMRQCGSGSGGNTEPTSRRLVNRLQEHKVICTKSGLASVLAAIQAAAVATTATAASAASAIESSEIRSKTGSGSGLDTSWIPETYVVPAGPKAVATGGSSLALFKAAFSRHAAAGRRVWIAKPTCLNRGNGIEVFDSLDRILEHIKGRPAGSSLILQKYIERPMLLGGRKFDIRAYVLVGPDGSVWFHREAYVRTSSTPYDSSDLSNRSAHLTNDAVQKHLDTYHAFEDHCKLSLEDLGPALRGGAPAPAPAPAPASASQTPAAPETTMTTTTSATAITSPLTSEPAAGPTATATATASSVALDTRPGCESGLWGAMRRCVAALFSVAGPRLNPRCLVHCYELLGLDFMLDDEGKLYLIEVNTSPAPFRAGAYLSDLLPRLIEEVVQKVVDPVFPSPPPPPSPPPSQPTGEAAAGEPEVKRSAAEAAPRSPLLDGFVRVELDEQLAAAAAAAASSLTSSGKAAGSRRVAGSPPAVGLSFMGGATLLPPRGESKPPRAAAAAAAATAAAAAGGRGRNGRPGTK
ncbi:hypothetical protein VOLCADRAFT_105441 [Volvox carteri f. nagariensis]|uniref:Uncharacterized protein ttlD n=1 Tax=Volvox carteri f. nagariensis TaxID=3068 RepID=D8U0U4_VOLCA|nr:uncharacterized protein VOLCADRAFT_105441 [Volvox carteri f. nagariensis]EFJ46701.1 hypothetical protein VOLCADRAFT_105441 [Volvox carteri f. nagariensis]|eukprot:XP_002952230.1 hypothetical protein VOLCADRAFT_105441 [Volvox carteri f. nagariensis]